ncbi:FAD-dependent monooxygenase [Marinactinospora thermotolerans]|uniref:FAD-dependent monooxygenase n=1 Tax=Marinactinospora thermotolerans TaxID=531310 RepID=UPI003D94278A
MRIVIVGGGIGGLTLAGALARGGVRAEVLEQSHTSRSPGAGVRLSPNASRPLLRLGLGERLAAVSVRPERRDLLCWDSGERIGSTPMGEFYERRYAAPYYTLLRSDLHAAVRSLVPREQAHPGRYVTDLLESSDGIALRCSDGHEVYADVVVGADGLHSAVRGAVRPERQHFAGISVHRGLVPVERSPFATGERRVRVWLGPDRHFTCYPVDAGRLISFTAMTPAPRTRPGSWGTRDRIADLLRAFEGWDPRVRALVSASDWIGVWPLQEYTTLASWWRGRIALLGDAAHPMPPFLAQGTNLAVEDAIVLAACLRGADVTTVQDALARYSALREERVRRVREGCWELLRLLYRDDGESPILRAAAVASAGAEIADPDWLYGHDVDRVTAGLP